MLFKIPLNQKNKLTKVIELLDYGWIKIKGAELGILTVYLRYIFSLNDFIFSSSIVSSKITLLNFLNTLDFLLLLDS